MLTIEQATAGPWTVVAQCKTGVCSLRITQCEADPRLVWHVTTPRGRRGRGHRPQSHFAVLPSSVDGVASIHKTMAAAVAALNALDQQEAAHG